MACISPRKAYGRSLFRMAYGFSKSRLSATLHEGESNLLRHSSYQLLIFAGKNLRGLTMSAKIHVINAISDSSASLAPQLDYLKELSGGDQNFITEILEMFITEAPQSVEQSFRYLQERNFDMLRITVHKLKSSVQVVGGYHLTHLIHEIEAASKESGTPDILEQMLSILSSGIQHMVNHLCKEVQSFNQTRKAA